MTDQAKDRVRKQFGSVGDAYVRSLGHATGSDLARMVELAQPQPNECLLDIATGGGHVARTFSPLVAEMVATDLTPEILEQAATYLQSLGLANIRYELADAEALPFPNASFDIVTCRIAPHHFPHPDAFLLESARVLKSAGRFILIDSTVPPGDIGTFFNRFEKLRDPSHVRSLTVDEWSTLLDESGLDLVHKETFTKRHDFTDWTSRSLMADTDRATLQRLMLDADDVLRSTFQVEIVDGHLIAFQDTKTLFVATRS